MKTLRRDESPAGSFTALELDAAEQLVLLSGSSSSGSTSSGSSSSTNSSLSVNAPTPPPPAPATRRTTPAPAAPLVPESAVAAFDAEGREADWDERPRRRYRLIAEIYAATKEIK
uniref:Uncharacterized protein n=1 Tax=Leersia perrieri TaxID=77586 RepID=A0A0D9XG65_9ORYZ